MTNTQQSAGPLISVLTATKNVEAMLPRLLQSLERQTYRSFEWIVVDGLSSDSTVEFLREAARKHPWVKFVSEADFGLYHALNKGISLAAGQYYIVAGADDSFTDEAFEHYARCAVSSTADVVLACVVRGERTIGGYYPHRCWISHSSAFRGSHSVGMLFRKDLHLRYGLYSRSFPLLADGYFLKLLLRSGDVRFCNADFVAGTFAEGGLTTSNKLQILAETWQIQMLTERHSLVQLLLFFGKILVRLPALLSELRARRKSSAVQPKAGAPLA